MARESMTKRENGKGTVGMQYAWRRRLYTQVVSTVSEIGGRTSSGPAWLCKDRKGEKLGVFLAKTSVLCWICCTEE